MTTTDHTPPDPASEAAAWFFENADAVFMEVRDSRTIRISPGWTSLLGWSEAEALGRPIWDFVHPEDIAVVKAGVKRIQTHGRSTYEHRVLTRSGAYMWMRVRAKGSEDGTGMAVLQNITEERRLAQERAEMSKANALLNAAAGVHLWRYDPGSDEYDLDPDFSQRFADIPDGKKTSGDTVRGTIDPADLDAVMAAFHCVLDSGEATVIDHRAHDELGRLRQVRSAWIGAHRLPCGRNEVIGLTQDLTELMTERDRALAGEQAAMAGQRAKAEFLANISHELRTPMNGLLGALHLARDASPEDKTRLIDEALASGAALADFLGDIVDFADGERGGLDVHRTPQSTRELLSGAIGLFTGHARSSGLWLRLSNSVDERLLIDGQKFRQVLRELIDNALKFTSQGGVDIAVLLRGDGRRRRLVVEVRDTGMGISAEDQRRLFETFQQGDGSSTRRFGGAGLGLATARQLAELMEGTITCESSPGGGSTFRFTLPVEKAPPERCQSRHADRPQRVLAVDDNPTNLKLVVAILSAIGVDVRTACDGAEALTEAAGGGYDAILMDIQMPVMDGVEATRRIRAIDGPVGRTPIIALTANVLPDQRALYERVGMDACLAKPISPAALMAELARLTTVSTMAA